MDLIYKIYSVYLYDNQLDHEWVILHNKYKSSIESDIGYYFSQALTKIFNLPKKDKKEKSIKIIQDVMKDEPDKMFIKNDGFISLKKIIDTHDPRYSVYEIYWNETKSGINIMEYDYCSPYSPGESSTSCYRIFQERENRIAAIREFNLECLLNHATS